MNQVIYPDGSREDVTEELLENGSDLQRANVPLTYLRLVVKKPREFKGTMGVTSALNGMRYNYLRWKVRPDFDLAGSAFMALGISSHNMLDENVADKDESEKWLTDGLIVGRSDLLEKEGGFNILTDYKVSGSYKVMTAMGIVEGPKKPLFDDEGNPVLYKRSGKGYKAGDQKMEKTYKLDPAKADNWEYAMQLNMYRLMYEKAGTKIDKMQIFFIVRDGGIMTAKNRGVTENIYTLEIPRMEDEVVEQFFKDKSEGFKAIMDAAEGIEGLPEDIGRLTREAGIDVPMCNSRENWDGRKCQGYCSYSEACKGFGDNKHLGA